MDTNQPNQAVFDQFLKKLSTGKSEEEVGQILASLFELESESLYEVMAQVLTDEDFDVIEKIEDDQMAEDELMKRFQERTGMTPQDFVEQLRDAVATKYIQPTTSPDK